MIKIENQTEENIELFNAFFSVTIPAGETAEIKREELKGEDKLFCRHLSNRGLDVKTDYGLSRKGTRKKFSPYYEKKFTFPLITIFSVQSVDTLSLKETEIPLRDILIFRVVRLKKITAKEQNPNIKEEYLFSDENAKKQFLKLMRISILYFPVAIINLLVCIFYFLPSNEMDWVERAMAILFLFAIALVIIQDFYHYLIGRKFKIFEECGTAKDGRVVKMAERQIKE